MNYDLYVNTNVQGPSNFNKKPTNNCTQTVSILQCTVYSVHSTVCNVHTKLNNLQCKLYTDHCTLQLESTENGRPGQLFPIALFPEQLY